jgi:hypothetical protein
MGADQLDRVSVEKMRAEKLESGEAKKPEGIQPSPIPMGEGGRKAG